jgi:hypothetical protein
VGAVAWTGDHFGIHMGPFALTPTEDFVDKMGPYFKQYGERANTTIYADKSICVGINLVGKPMLNSIQPVPIWRKRKFYGLFKAPYQIHAVGVAKSCKFCPALTDLGHSTACAVNQADLKAFQARKTKKQHMLANVEKGIPVPKSRTVVARLAAPSTAASSKEPGEI